MDVNWDDLAQQVDDEPIQLLRQAIADIEEKHGALALDTFVLLANMGDRETFTYRMSFKGNRHTAIGMMTAYCAALVDDAKDEYEDVGV